MTQWDQLWSQSLERDLLATSCRDSFYQFARLAYGITNNPRGKWFTPRIHKPLCDWFEGHVKEWLENRRANRSIQKRLLIIIPREFGKTTLITQAGQLWLHVLDPEISTFTGSESVSRAVEFFRPVKTILDGSDPYSRFAWLYGNWYDKTRTWRDDRLDHAARRGIARKDPSMGTWGVESGLTGAHPDAIFFDDPISYERLSTYSNWIDVVNSHVSSLEPVLTGDGLMVFIGTRYHDGDHLGAALKAGIRENAGMPLPNITPKDDTSWNCYYLQARDNQGVPIYPEQWSAERLAEWESKDNLKFYAQMMNDPGSSEYNPFTRAQAYDCYVDRAHVPRNLRVTIHMDTAFKDQTRQARGDESVLQVWGHTRDGSGDVYFLEGYSSNIWRMEDYLKKLVQVLQRLNKMPGRYPYIITDERTMGGKEGAWEMAIQNFCHQVNLTCPRVIFLSRAGKNKMGRIVEAASYWADGHVKLVEDAPGVQQLVDQMVRIGQSAHDDWSDAAADVFCKEVYHPMRRGDVEDAQPPEQSKPWDDILKPGKLTDEAAMKLYDRYFDRSDTYDPV